MSRDLKKLVSQGLKSRYRNERIMRTLGISALLFASGFLLLILSIIFSQGYRAFTQTYIEIPVELSVADIEDISSINFQNKIRDGLRELFPELQARAELADLFRLISRGASIDLERDIYAETIPGTINFIALASSDVDMVNKGYFVDSQSPQGRLSEQQYEYFQSLSDRNLISRQINTNLFLRGDSSYPEMAGVMGAIMGSVFVLGITLLLSFPIGAATAIYLEEFAPKNRFTDFIEVNINNLAAVPSVIFGLLGLAMFINFFGFPRSAPIVGGFVLTLMTLPIVIIASRAAITSVPPSIKEAALGLGASKLKMVVDHVIPLALPGMLTGTIIGMARALGESAPLLMIGMVAFITEIPQTIFSPSTTLPIQIFLWADSPDRGFSERTSAAIIILLVFLILMNLLAVILRKKFEKKW
jgi:phosphate transport system permease protein